MIRAIAIVVFGILAGCDLRPAPRAEPPPPPAPPPPPSPAPPPPDAAVADPARVAACAASSTRVTDIYIAAAPAANRAQLQDNRATLIERMRDACVTGAWSAAALACLDAATTAESIVKCDALIRPRAPADGAPAPDG